VRLNRIREAATKWSGADRERAIVRLEREIHQMTPVKCKLFDRLLQHHKRQLLQEVGTKPISPRSTFAKKIAQMKTATEEAVYRAVNINPDKWVELLVRLSDSETEDIT